MAYHNDDIRIIEQGSLSDIHHVLEPTPSFDDNLAQSLRSKSYSNASNIAVFNFKKSQSSLPNEIIIRDFISKKIKKDRKKNLKKKKVSLIHFTFKQHYGMITNYINPKKYVRYMDYYLPLDSSFLKDNYQEQNLVRCFSDFRDFKRIVSVTHDIGNKLYLVDLEELYAHQEPVLFISHDYNYYHAWLMSLGDLRCYKLANYLEKLRRYREEKVYQVLF